MNLCREGPRPDGGFSRAGHCPQTGRYGSYGESASYCRNIRAGKTGRTPDIIDFMQTTPPPPPLRLRKKHGSGKARDVHAADGERLVLAQSPRNALVAGLLTIAIFCVLWIGMSTLFNRVFPWMTIFLGAMLGFAIRHAGRGVDWRFPALAALLTLLGALFANIVVAASYTAEMFDTSTLLVLRSVTSMTWPVFFDEVLTPADGFYAVFAAGFAAFLSNRQLTRSQYYALRLWRAESDGHN